MQVKIIKQYNDAPVFSTKDFFFEALINGETKVNFVQCQDKNSKHLHDVQILSVNNQLTKPSQMLVNLKIDEEELIESLIEAVEKFHD